MCVFNTLEIQLKVIVVKLYVTYVINIFLKYILIELVQTVTDWFNTKIEKHNLNYCKYLCSSRVLMLLQPSDHDSDESSGYGDC